MFFLKKLRNWFLGEKFGLKRDLRQKVITCLEDKGLGKPCPMCKTGKFDLLDGYLNPKVYEQKQDQKITLGGSSVPNFVLVCENCGYLSNHSAGLLGLMEDLKR